MSNPPNVLTGNDIYFTRKFEEIDIKLDALADYINNLTKALTDQVANDTDKIGVNMDHLEKKINKIESALMKHLHDMMAHPEGVGIPKELR